MGWQCLVQPILGQLVWPWTSKHGWNVKGLVVEEEKEDQRWHLVKIADLLGFFARDVELTHHPVGSQGSLDITCQHVGRVMPVVRDPGQPSVDGQQNQEKLQCWSEQPSPSPCQPCLQVKLGRSRIRKHKRLSKVTKLFHHAWMDSKWIQIFSLFIYEIGVEFSYWPVINLLRAVRAHQGLPWNLFGDIWPARIKIMQ